MAGGERAVLEEAAEVATTYFAARGLYDWDAAAAAATGAAARFAEHLGVAHLVAGRTAPLPERPTVEADLAGAERDGSEVAVDGTVTVRWSDGREEAFDGLRFADTGGRLLLADYANPAGPLSDHLVDGHGLDTGRAGAVEVAVVAAVWLAPEPVVAVTVRLGNGGDVPVAVDDGGVSIAPAGGGRPVPAAHHWDVAAPAGADGWALAELVADDLPVDGGRLLVDVAADDGRPLGTASVDLPPFPAAD